MSSLRDVGKSGIMPGQKRAAAAARKRSRSGQNRGRRRAGTNGTNLTRRTTDTAPPDMRLQDASFPAKDSFARRGRPPCSACAHDRHILTETSLFSVATSTNSPASSHATACRLTWSFRSTSTPARRHLPGQRMKAAPAQSRHQ